MASRFLSSNEESDTFWELYWEIRLQALQNQGKKEAILAISNYMRRISASRQQPLRLLELGCGEGQIIGPLVEGHAQICSAAASTGVDYLPASIQEARRAYPALSFLEGDFTDADFIKNLGQFDIVILVNALHEVFSASYSAVLNEVDVSTAKQRVEGAFSLAADAVMPGGYLALFDGLEPSEDLQRKIQVRFLTAQSLENFKTFAREYHPFRVNYRMLGSSNIIEISQRDFTRYITKSIFLGKRLWTKERLESYQYFREQEFRSIFERNRLDIQELRTLTVNEEKWRRNVKIETPGVRFPEEHILIIAKKRTA